MCGIAGIFDTQGEPADLLALARMSRTIGHRGPDGERFYVDGSLGLAQRHLRIIDLSDAAMQPMANEDESVWLIFNGEIYNYIELTPELKARGHIFRSHSDTEVVLHAYEEWGVECLHHFNGMFAFALWDSRKQRLFLARDRMGVKPLYYTWQDSTLIFASEIKAILSRPEVSARPHLSAIAEYMNAMYTTGEHTWFEGILRLLPGHYMLVDRDGMAIRRWWDVPANEDDAGKHTERYYVERTRELLEDSVRLRLRSDVPLGAHLSGGLDSSSIVALYSRLLAASGEPVRTFSGAFAEGRAYDERRYVRDVVRRYHTDHHETVPTSHDLASLMDHMTWHMDEPAAGPGILLQYKVCEITRAAGVIVINGGQGGDEEWGGYYGYVPAYMRMLVGQTIHDPLLAPELAKTALTLLLREDTRQSMIKALANGRRGRLEADAGAGAWAGSAFDDLGSATNRVPPEPNLNGRTPLGRAMYRDLKWYLPALLQVEDRMSMAHSLESRAPLLDYRLVEHAASVPSVLKLKNLEMKHIYKQAVKDLLPASVYRRTDKKGMPTPIAPWFNNSLSSWVHERLNSPSLAASGIVSEHYVRDALMEHRSGKRDRSIDLWKLLSIESWWRTYIEGGSSVESVEAVDQKAVVGRSG